MVNADETASLNWAHIRSSSALNSQCLISRASRKNGDTDMTNQFLKKMENHATREATRLDKGNHGKLRLIGTAIGIVVVVLVALWMAYHS
jgi:hypothetical protein